MQRKVITGAIWPYSWALRPPSFEAINVRDLMSHIFASFLCLYKNFRKKVTTRAEHLILEGNIWVKDSYERN